MNALVNIRHLAVLWAITVVSMALLSCSGGNMRDDMIIDNDDFFITGDSVVQGNMVATALSPTHVITGYNTQADDSVPDIMRVRLAINCRDNELLPGSYHYINLKKDTTTLVACHADTLSPEPTGNIKRPEYVNLKIDLSEIEKAMSDKGFFVTPTADTIYSADYNGVWITGDMAPLNIRAASTWKYNELMVNRGKSTDGVYEIKIPLAVQPHKIDKEWEIKEPAADAPVFSSKQNIVDAAYNMAVDQLLDSKAHDSKFIVAQDCYTIALALAYLKPQESMKRLKAMVNKNNEVSAEQPGSYRSLVNCMMWTTAAWSVYCATGDKQWLSSVITITQNSLKHTHDYLLDNTTGLYRASSPYFTAGTAQYYPEWCTTVDAMESMPLVGNAIMEHTYRLLELMADEFDMTDNDYASHAEHIKDAINHRLWNENAGCYSQYLYGGTVNMMSPCVDNLGQALCVLLDIADDNRAETLIKSSAISSFGIPLVYPASQGAGTELLNTMHPMVQALWNLAAAKAGNMNMLRRGMASLYRHSIMLASCRGACDFITGEPLDCGTTMGNAAGNVAMVLNVLAGMNFLPDGIEFAPKVPVCYSGKKTLKGFNYRNMTLDITISGTGLEIKKISLDGKSLEDNFIAASLTGDHKVEIEMSNDDNYPGKVTLAQHHKVLPAAPQWLWNGFYATNYTYNGILGYKILINGEPTYSMRDTVMGTRDTTTFRTYSLVAINKYGHSFMARPHPIMTQARNISLGSVAPALKCDDVFPDHYPVPIALSADSVWVSAKFNTTRAGDYLLDLGYSNGNGVAGLHAPAMAILILANGHPQGVVVTPQLGDKCWLIKNYSSKVTISLLKGENTIKLRRINLWNTASDNSTLRLHNMRIIKK